MKNPKKYICISLIFIIIQLITLPAFANDTSYVWSNNSSKLNANGTIQTSSEISNDNSINLESGAAILIEQSTGQILYAHNIHEQLRPASVTKIMSVLLIMEQIHNGNLSMEEQISCSETASSMGGSQIWLDTRETLSVSDMLKAICVVSANDYKLQLRHKKFQILKLKIFIFNFFIFYFIKFNCE